MTAFQARTTHEVEIAPALTGKALVVLPAAPVAQFPCDKTEQHADVTTTDSVAAPYGDADSWSAIHEVRVHNKGTTWIWIDYARATPPGVLANVTMLLIPPGRVGIVAGLRPSNDLYGEASTKGGLAVYGASSLETPVLFDILILGEAA